VNVCVCVGEAQGDVALVVGIEKHRSNSVNNIHAVRKLETTSIDKFS